MTASVAAVAAICLAAVAGCGESKSEPGPIIDNLLWQITDAGAELFGSPPADAGCPPNEGCPVPDGECVRLTPGCRPTYIAECYPPFTVLSVYTSFCDWVTLEQPLLRDIRAGDEVETRTFHFALTAPSGGEARVGLAIGDEMAFDRRFTIPQGSGLANNVWTAPKDFPAGTRVLFHVDNHGSNEYLLVEANLCDGSQTPGEGCSAF